MYITISIFYSNGENIIYINLLVDISASQTEYCPEDIKKNGGLHGGNK